MRGWWVCVAAAATAVAVVLKVRKMLRTAAFALNVPSLPEEARLVLKVRSAPYTAAYDSSTVLVSEPKPAYKHQFL